MKKSLGYWSVLASAVTSLIIVVVFYILGMQKVSGSPGIYTTVDVYGGAVYVFILSMIISASVLPGIIEKRMKK
ncbi:MAG: hypothetical protein OIN89_01810 [Candidatus Methanoperedens sp.]|jgi:hypothetical protein|nr:hypothetical protein [Candidatus Methanoperedens sp.]PKL54487.1 MAG: hypothetical protein CVV36_01775 [Candidatus Methanoperedenaceae archaeon HGW-Methanoperedenaceae-1]